MIHRSSLPTLLGLLPLLFVAGCDQDALAPGSAGSSSTQSSSSSGSSSTTSSSSSSSTSSTTTNSSAQDFQVAVTGLASGGSLQFALTYSGTNELNGTLSDNGTSLVTGPPLPSGDSYSFAVTSSPTGQACSVANGTGTLTAQEVPPVVSFTCTATTATSAKRMRSADAPGGRAGAVSWVDRDGDLTLFGGETRDASGAPHTQNDLWRYVPALHAWQPLEIDGPVPAARSHAASWLDAAGNVWIFGGQSAAESGVLYQDLWEFDGSAQQWICTSGCADEPSPVSTAAAPTARVSAATWVDAAGDFWLFGGAAAGHRQLGDTWRFSPATRQWTQESNSPAEQ